MLRLTQSAITRPGLWIVLTLVVTGFFAAGIPRLRVRTDGEAIQPTTSAAVHRTRADRTRFHDPEQIVLLVGLADGGPVATRAGLDFVAALHDSLERFPGVQGSAIQSLHSLLELDASLAAAAPPNVGAEADSRLDRLRRSPVAVGTLLSKDGRHAALYLPLAENVPRERTIAALESWIRSHTASTAWELRLLGPAVAEASLGSRVLADLGRLVPLMVAAIAVLLALGLRTPGGVLVPLLEAMLVLVWTLGAMGWCRAPVTLVTTILPVVLMAMAITDEIHLLDRLQAHLAGLPARRPIPGAILLVTMRDVGGPIVATSLTTGIGFLSFASASIPPLRDFGVFTGFGIAVAMFQSFTFVPALAVCLPARWFMRQSGSTAIAPAHLPFEARITRRPTALALVGLALLALAAPGVARLEVQDSWVENFDVRSPLVRAEHDYNASFWGSYRYDIVIEGEPGFFLQPAGMQLLEAVERAARAGPRVGGVASALSPLREVATSLGIAEAPSDLRSDALAQLASVAQMAETATGFGRFVTLDGRAARLRVHVPSADYERSRDVDTALQQALPPLLQGHAWHSSGELPVALDVVHAIVGNQLRSIGWALAGIFVVVLVLLRRPDAALVVTIPVSAAAFLVFGGMGWSGVPLGIATSMFASLSIGVGIDFALHALHHYRVARGAGAAHASALEAAFLQSGAAIRWNAVVLSLGLLVLAGSHLRPDRTLGVLLAASVLACYAMTLCFLPILTKVLRPAPNKAA